MRESANTHIMDGDARAHSVTSLGNDGGLTER